eukprot:TRINITY_DN101599_c0_g1_i1.p1 TRINITY_DN101599_c0_g1~~TRINITY_DN101599_c0_g1_i1.p1  ORF type:complete len:106 (+),score=23.50 TRINITY_DN101599_c0_g1_i1:40-318(+)
MSQHVEIFSSENKDDEKGAQKNVGVFEEKLDMRALVEEAAAASRFLVQKQYISAPEVELEIYDRSKKGKQNGEIGRAVQQECRDRSRMPSSA